VIEVVEYDEAWAVRAAAARADLISLGVFDAAENALAGLGYRRLDTRMPGRLFYYRDEDGQRANQLHVVPADTWDARNERLLLDHLRSHPADARRYAELKQRLTAEHTDGTEYTKAKTELIQELTDRARADRGLPPVPVWEE
jgi:GrpB-like predicted nucleotidyltransferase (UPF0157 family)